VYEPYVSSLGVGTLAGPPPSHYPLDPAFIWDGAYGIGKILYKEKVYTYSANELDNFNILVMEMANKADQVVIFTFTFHTTGSPLDADTSGNVTRTLRIDYSGVSF
jgi:hypothetical protein